MPYHNLAVGYALAWNDLDATIIAGALTEDFEYTSQMVLQTMHGREAYLAYLAGKFDTIRATGARVEAEVAMWEGLPCVLLVQHHDELQATGALQKTPDGGYRTEMTHTLKAALLLRFRDGLISSACMCAVPTYDEVKHGAPPQTRTFIL